jgi:Ion transport protein
MSSLSEATDIVTIPLPSHQIGGRILNNHLVPKIVLEQENEALKLPGGGEGSLRTNLGEGML